MNSFGVVEDEILGKLPVKKLFIRKKAHMIVNELLLDGSVVPFDIGIDLWAPGIGEDVEDTFISMSVCYKSSREVEISIGIFRSIVSEKSNKFFKFLLKVIQVIGVTQQGSELLFIQLVVFFQ